MLRLIFLVETYRFPSSVLKTKTGKLISKSLSLYSSTHGVTFDKTVFVVVYEFRKNEVATGNARRGRDSSVGIATRYGLDGPGIESRWGARFSAPVQTGPGAHPASYTLGTGPFPRVKRPGRGVDPPPSSAEVKERVELYLSSTLGPSWPVLE